MPPTKFYAVRVGRRPGVYNTWAECEEQVRKYPGALHKSFKIYTAAEDWIIAPRAEGYAATVNLRNTLNDDLADFQSDSKTTITSGISSKESGVKRKRELTPGHEVPRPTLRTAGKDIDSIHPPMSQQIDEKPIVSAPDPVLSPQQSQILQRILNGENFFFTGSAGTGKSVLLRAVIKAFQKNARLAEQDSGTEDDDEYHNRLKRRKNNVIEDVLRWNLAVTASTGMAGVNIGGVTIHSWAGIGLGKAPAGACLGVVRKSSQSVRRWMTTGALVIDEISMIDGRLLDKLDYIGRSLRRDPRPFGGIQVIISGDFFQLPPVAPNDLPQFAFEADCWPKLFPPGNMMALSRVFRQREDHFVNLLESMRKGKVSAEGEKLLRSLNRPIGSLNGVEPVGLYPNKQKVTTINQKKLDGLEGEEFIYRAYDIPGRLANERDVSLEDAKKALNRNTLWPEVSVFKVGAQVMLVTNIGDGTLVNGSTGTITDFMTVGEAREAEIPFIISTQPLIKISTAIKLPVVEFAPSRFASDSTPQKGLVMVMQVDCMNPAGFAEATRVQVPLILAWALTIHKSQGQTIERVTIDLRGTFAEGQAYVAISRGVSLDGIEVIDYHSNYVKVNPRVVEWAQGLGEAEQAEEEWGEMVKNLCVQVV